MEGANAHLLAQGRIDPLDQGAIAPLRFGNCLQDQG
jgi:hypothetical protein